MQFSEQIHETKLTDVGDLTFANAQQFFADMVVKFKPGVSLSIGFSESQNIDTAGLASLICLVITAKKQNCKLIFTSLSSRLVQLIKIYNVEGFFYDEP